MAFIRDCLNPQFAPTAIRVALVVGSLLFAINHGAAVVGGRMSRDRWLAALLTYMVPYMVNVHGQASAVRRRQHLPLSPTVDASLHQPLRSAGD
ncbi:MAG: nitrate/nitrite transporter NrtS [Synechococcaceae cyanobacterium SM2_3_60]|nr:nitrate/nitrite transporter NrtS [Synechococcaceae cyanobacterium SM2_3_60]